MNILLSYNINYIQEDLGLDKNFIKYNSTFIHNEFLNYIKLGEVDSVKDCWEYLYDNIDGGHGMSKNMLLLIDWHYRNNSFKVI